MDKMGSGCDEDLMQFPTADYRKIKVEKFCIEPLYLNESEPTVAEAVKLPVAIPSILIDTPKNADPPKIAEKITKEGVIVVAIGVAFFKL